MILQQCLLQAKSRLACIADQPMLEAEILLAHALRRPRSYLHAFGETEISDIALNNFNLYLNRRFNREPIAYILGQQEFWSLGLQVSADTLIPRPETELLVESILMLEMPTGAIRVADLGTGCGTIALALAHERLEWHLYATDISVEALKIAKRNAAHLKLDNILFFQGDWCHALPQGIKFDVIVSNPPYIAQDEWAQYASHLAHEPQSALIAGSDGLDAIRAILGLARYHLKPEGYLVVEHGFTQGQAVREIYAANGYQGIDSKRDLAGLERMTLGRLALK